MFFAVMPVTVLLASLPPQPVNNVSTSNCVGATCLPRSGLPAVSIEVGVVLTFCAYWALSLSNGENVAGVGKDLRKCL